MAFGPEKVLFELTYRCNLKCKHCYLEGMNSKEQPLEFWKNAICLFSEVGTKYAIISGGEPQLYSDFCEVMLLAKLKGMRTILFTNGLLLNKNINNIKDCCVDKICVSIYGGTPATHDYVTGVPGSFLTLMENISAIKNTGILFELRMIVMNCNFSEINLAKNIAETHGAEFVLDSHLVPKIKTGQVLDEEQLSKSKKDILVQSVEGSNARYAPQNNECCSGGCRAASKLAIVSPCGEIYPCAKIRESIGVIKNGQIVINNKMNKIVKDKSIFPKICLAYAYKNLMK